MSLADVPIEVIRSVILPNLDGRTLLNLCQTDRRLSSLCNNQNVWRDIFNREYPNAWFFLNDANGNDDYRSIYIDALRHPYLNSSDFNRLFNLLIIGGINPQEVIQITEGVPDINIFISLDRVQGVFDYLRGAGFNVTGQFTSVPPQQFYLRVAGRFAIFTGVWELI